MKKCNTCGETKPLNEFHSKTVAKDGLTGHCIICGNESLRKSRAGKNEHLNKQARGYYRKARVRRRKERKDYPEREMVIKSRGRAKKKKVPHDIKAGDIIIPKKCPICGAILRTHAGRIGKNNKSLDRIIPKLGYVKGNIIVICRRCNMIKNDATPDEILRIGNFYKNLEKRSL